MGSSTAVGTESADPALSEVCSACGGQKKILYPFPGDAAGCPLGGVKIRPVTCLECNGSGKKMVSKPAVAQCAARR